LACCTPIAFIACWKLPNLIRQVKRIQYSISGPRLAQEEVRYADFEARYLLSDGMESARSLYVERLHVEVATKFVAILEDGRELSLSGLTVQKLKAFSGKSNFVNVWEFPKGPIAYRFDIFEIEFDHRGRAKSAHCYDPDRTGKRTVVRITTAQGESNWRLHPAPGSGSKQLIADLGPPIMINGGLPSDNLAPRELSR
jgi:hypothetical protein